MTLLFIVILSFKNWSHSTLRWEEFTHSKFVHFITQLGRIYLVSHTWPYNPHDCGNSQPKPHPHTTTTTRTPNHSIVPPRAIKLSTQSVEFRSTWPQEGGWIVVFDFHVLTDKHPPDCRGCSWITNNLLTCLHQMFSICSKAKINKINAEIKHTQFLRGKHL